MRRLILLLCACLVILPTARADKVDDLTRELKDREYGNYWDRLDACRDLGKEDSVKAVRALALVLADKEAAIREAAVMGLAKISDTAAKQEIYKLATRDRNPIVRANAIWALRMAKDDKAATLIIGALRDRAAPVRAQAARALVALEAKAAGATLAKLMRDTNAESLIEIIRACGRLDVQDATPQLIKLCKSGKPMIKAEALQALARLDFESFKPTIERAVKDSKAETRMGLAYALAQTDPMEAFAPATDLVKDKDWRVRTIAIDTLVKLREKRCIEPLITQMVKEKGRLRYDFAVALETLTGKDLGYDGTLWQRWWSGAKEKFELPEKKKENGSKKNGEPGAGKTVARFFGVPILSDAVVFAIDFSGSMKNELTKGPYAKNKKTKIAVAFEQLESALDRFQNKQRFTGINVSTEATVRKKRLLTPQLVQANRGNKAKALAKIKDDWKFLEKIKRGRGDFYDALVQGTLQIRNTDTILLLSDGKPTYGEYIDRINFVPEWVRFNKYRRVHVHTILIGGKGRDRDFMEALSKASGGVMEDATGDK